MRELKDSVRGCLRLMCYKVWILKLALPNNIHRIKINKWIDEKAFCKKNYAWKYCNQFCFPTCSRQKNQRSEKCNLKQSLLGSFSWDYWFFLQWLRRVSIISFAAFYRKCKKCDEGMLPNLHFKYKFRLSRKAINETYTDTKRTD